MLFGIREMDGSFSPGSFSRWNYGVKGEKLEEEKRYLAFQRFVWGCIHRYRPDCVGYEYVQFNQGKSVIAGMRAILLAAVEEEGLLCHGVNVATVKKLAGSSDKEIMRDNLADRCPALHAKVENTNDSDAAWVAIWMVENVQ